MEKKFEKPELEIVYFTNEDIITDSIVGDKMMDPDGDMQISHIIHLV